MSHSCRNDEGGGGKKMMRQLEAMKGNGGFPGM
jgi:hypothetical protein